MSSTPVPASRGPAQEIAHRDGAADVEPAGRVERHDQPGAWAISRAITMRCRLPPESANAGRSSGGTGKARASNDPVMADSRARQSTVAPFQ